MTLIANRQLTGDYGTIAPGQIFDADEGTAQSLIQRGLARPIHAATYETKVITPEKQEVQPLPADPFRYLPDPDAEPPSLATRRDWMRSVSDVQEPGDSGGVERTTGGGSYPARSEAPAPSGQADNRGDSKRRMRRRSR